MAERFEHLSFVHVSALFALVLAILVGFYGCGGSGNSDSSSSSGGNQSTSGDSFHSPETVLMSPYNAAGAIGEGDASIDISSVSQGYIAAKATASSRLKLQVKKDDMSYNYDLPNNGTPISVPVNMGDGTYEISIMQNTTESRYIRLFSTTANIVLESVFIPFLRPNMYCNYTADGTVVTKARELVANAQNEGDALRFICEWVIDNITYDRAKASELAGGTGYIPDPAETLKTHKGICFDYASLAAAMLRSQGIPCEIITGYVAPNGVYHAWNLVWINGSWKSISLTVNPRTWTRVDATFAAGGDTSTVGDGSKYEQRYVY